MKALRHRILIVLVVATVAVTAFGSEPDYPYTVRKGEITVFGYRLQSDEISELSEEAYYVAFKESPNKQFILIVYDAPFDKGAVWLYDKFMNAPPQPIKQARLGMHFGAEWYGSQVFALSGAGMGYETSRLYRIDNLNHYKELLNIIAYDPERDLYALLERDKDFKFSIVVGRAFHDIDEEERFFIPLYDQDLVGAISYIENLEFIVGGIAVTYKNREGKTITQTFQSTLVENAIP